MTGHEIAGHDNAGHEIAGHKIHLKLNNDDDDDKRARYETGSEAANV